MNNQNLFNKINQWGIIQRELSLIKNHIWQDAISELLVVALN